MAGALLLIGMVGIEFSDSLKFLVKWAMGTTIVMTIAALILGVKTIEVVKLNTRIMTNLYDN